MRSIELIQEAADILERAQIHRPHWTAEQLLAERLGCLPVDLYVQTFPIPADESARFLADAAARAGGVPLQYVLGSAEFYGREFEVGPGVFIPRPETEVLIEVVMDSFTRATQVVDVGTGSGVIAVTLAKERPGLRWVAVERSTVALHFARRNALRHGCAVHLLQGDLLGSLAAGCVDGVVANLPYLIPEEAGSWPRELAWEPWLALDGGRGGMELTAKLMGQAATVLRPEGGLMLEIGKGQAWEVSVLAEQYGFRVERIVPDFAGIERVVALWKN